MVIRKYFHSGNLRLSYLDFGGDSQNILIMLHGHMGNARTFSELAQRFKTWRVIALDQRGHGWSDHAEGHDYSRKGYVSDIYHLIKQEFDGQPVTLLGHSLGGINAFQFAAWYPQYVKAMVVEEMGVDMSGEPFAFVDRLPNRTASLKELRASLAQLGLRDIDYFAESVFEDEHGWGFRSDLQGMKVSHQHLTGVWWDDWLSSSCPTLLVHGKRSSALDLQQAEQMVSRRPNTRLAVFADCGHGVHFEDLDGFSRVVTTFLNELV